MDRAKRAARVAEIMKSHAEAAVNAAYCDSQGKRGKKKDEWRDMANSWRGNMQRYEIEMFNLFNQEV